jgi:hypothetical protein
MVVAMNGRNAVITRTILVLVVVVGLAYDAYVHVHLAPAFKHVKTSTLSQADLFHVEAVLAVIAAVALLVRPRRYTAAFAFLVAAGGFVAVMLYRYVDVGAFGPVPNMYDPYWAPASKNWSAVAEGVAALAALTLLLLFQARVRGTGRVSLRTRRAGVV